MPDSSGTSQRQDALKFGISLDEIIDELKSQLDGGDGDKTYRYLASSKGIQNRLNYPEGMEPSVIQGVKDYIGLGRAPYGHQSRAWRALVAGNSLILTTPTASGKTMAFNPVILNEVLYRKASALYVFPLVDLATSQEDSLMDLIRKTLPYTGNKETPHVSGIHSGSSQSWEEKIKGRQDFVLTTPESLHQTLLPRNYSNWSDFFKRLRFVVLDEAHVYSGIFGSNMAFILRRLAHRCIKEGGRVPQFVICSATIREPENFARKLLPPGIDKLRLIRKSYAPAQARHEIACIAKSKVAVNLFTRLLDAEFTDEKEVKRRVRTIMFVRSRKAVQSFVQTVRKGLELEGREAQAKSFEGYMAGIPNARQIFERLRNGDLQSIVTTNKLMAGIDIGELDVSIVHGYQRRFLDMRQMFGRAGRRGTGAWIFIGHPNSLEDQYVVDAFPEVFECNEPEATVVDVSNTILRDAHLRCLDGYSRDESRHQEGPSRKKVVEEIFGAGVVIPPNNKCSNPWENSPLKGLQIRGANIKANYKLVLDGREECGEDAQTTTEALAFRDYHPGAIFETKEGVFHVRELQHPPSSRIIAETTTAKNMRTCCREQVEESILKEHARANRHGINYLLADFHIERVFSEYRVLELQEAWECPQRECDITSKEQGVCPEHKRKLRYARNWNNVNKKELVPALTIPLETTGVELDLSQVVLEYPGPADGSGDGPLVAFSSRMNALLNSIKTLVVNSYEDAYLAEGEILGVVVKPPYGLLFYDDFPGGIGVVRAIFDDYKGTIWRKSLNRIKNCKCRGPEGCVKCILPPFAQTGEMSTKQAALDFMEWFVLQSGAGGDQRGRK